MVITPICQRGRDKWKRRGGEGESENDILEEKWSALLCYWLSKDYSELLHMCLHLPLHAHARNQPPPHQILLFCVSKNPPKYWNVYTAIWKQVTAAGMRAHTYRWCFCSDLLYLIVFGKLISLIKKRKVFQLKNIIIWVEICVTDSHARSVLRTLGAPAVWCNNAILLSHVQRPCKPLCNCCRGTSCPHTESLHAYRLVCHIQNPRLNHRKQVCALS